MTASLDAADCAVIFDMDGILIDSEPLWREAEIQTFGEAGLALSEEDCFETQGLRIDEVVAYWARRQPLRGRSHAEIADVITARVGELVRQRSEPMSGVHEAIEAAARRGFQLGLASSSTTRLIETVLDHFDLAAAFRVVCSAQDDPLGKPHPGVYLRTAERLGVPPARCIAVEDSWNGVVSALAASMHCIAIPAPEQRGDPRFSAAAQQRTTLAGFDEALVTFLNASRSTAIQEAPHVDP